jgi:hypothetical protein
MKEELTRRDEMSLSGAALRGAPWKAAATTGGVAAATSFGLGVILPGDASLAWALCLGISLFSMVAAVGSATRPDVADRVTRSARQWARNHPWRFSLYPALGSAVLMYPVQLIIDREGPFSAALDALQGGVAVYLVTAVLAVVLGGRKQASLPRGR